MTSNLGRVGLGTIEVVAAMPRCRDCRWWEGMFEQFPDQFGGCLRSAQDGALMGGNEDIYADHTIATSPDFGCVQWEAKES